MTLMKYLNKLYTIQKDILLVSHPEETSSWKDRCYYLDENFNPQVHYNHRSILMKEVVLEYDYDNVDLNKELVDQAAHRLNKDGIKWSKWFSGNKSFHLHFFIDPKEAKRLNVLKSVILQYYGTSPDNSYKPDLQLAANAHNIRAEYGRHEKTGKLKILVSQTAGYPQVCDLPESVWIMYSDRVKAILKAQVTRGTKDLQTHPLIKQILDTTEFRKNDDGRERALFVLIHVLKPKYTKPELTKFLQEWYRYSGGRQLSAWAIACKINYHWDRQYVMTETFLHNLAYELGLERDTFKN